MALVRVPGGAWFPRESPNRWASTSNYSRGNFGLTDADQEEAQYIGRVCLAGGPGSKTFGTSGSQIGWLVGGGTQTFQSSATFTVGVKKSASIDLANGPPARATIGKAAFDVYKDLIGGTDAIGAGVNWRNDAMASGTPFTVTHGDYIAVCFLMTIVSAAQTISHSDHNNSGVELQLPTSTLVTSGPTYTNQTCVPNIVLMFDDGTLGWLEGSFVSSDNTGQVNVGNTNIYGNVFQFPFDCKVDAILALVGTSSTTNFDIGLWSTPAGTPTAMANGTISYDPQVMGSTGVRWLTAVLPNEVSLTANTAYLAGVKQNSATAVTLDYYDVNATGHLQVNGLDANTYAALSTAGAAVAAQNSGKRRAGIFLRVSQVNDTAAAGSGAALSRVMTGM